MKTNKKIGLISIVFLMFLSLFLGQTPSVNAQTTSGGVQLGAVIRENRRVHQYWPLANDIEMIVYVKPRCPPINGWQVRISGFTSSNSIQVGPREVSVEASGANIVGCTWIWVNVTIWLDTRLRFCPNNLGIRYNWTLDGQPLKAEPDRFWGWDFPQPNPQNLSQYLHLFNITNDDTTDYLNVTGLAFNATMNWYVDLTQIIFLSPYPNFTLAPGQSWSTNITTLGPLYGGHIYFKYNITGSETLSENYADHPVTEPPPVGGIWIPVDKFSLLTPYIALISTIILAVSISVAYIKYRKKQ